MCPIGGHRWAIRRRVAPSPSSTRSRATLAETEVHVHGARAPQGRRQVPSPVGIRVPGPSGPTLGRGGQPQPARLPQGNPGRRRGRVAVQPARGLRRRRQRGWRRQRLQRGDLRLQPVRRRAHEGLRQHGGRVGHDGKGQHRRPATQDIRTGSQWSSAAVAARTQPGGRVRHRPPSDQRDLGSVARVPASATVDRAVDGPAATGASTRSGGHGRPATSTWVPTPPPEWEETNASGWTRAGTRWLDTARVDSRRPTAGPSG
jgi:hypothetical protein